MNPVNVRLHLTSYLLCDQNSSHLGFSELNQLTGIAAILTFPLDVEVVEAEEKAAKEEEEDARLQAEHEASLKAS